MSAPEFGATAWGRTWLRTVERPSGPRNPQLPKARTLARNQKVTAVVDLNTLTATVIDGATSRDVEIHLPPWSTDEQATVEAALSDKAPHRLAGDVPDSVVDDLTAAGVAIAAPLSELQAQCTCTSRAHPCVHILAALYAFVLLADERPITALDARSRRRLDEPNQDWIPLNDLDPERFFDSPRACPDA